MLISTLSFGILTASKNKPQHEQKDTNIAGFEVLTVMFSGILRRVNW
jgi:hypothetical protein